MMEIAERVFFLIMGIISVLGLYGYTYFWWDTRQHNKDLEFLNERLKALAEKADQNSND